VNPEPETTEPKRKSNRARDGEPWYKQYVMVLALMILVTLACLPLAWVTDYHVSFIMFFAVLALAWSFITKEGPVIFASVLSASMWAFFFVPPFNTMKISNYQDLIAVVVFIAVAIGAGLLTLFVRQNERISRKREEKTATLFRLADRLATADTFEQIVAIAKEEVVRYFDTEIYFILQDGNGVITHEQIDTEPDGFDEAEFSTAQWSFAHLLKAGRYTDTLSSGQFTFYPMKGLNINLGVVAMRLRKIIDSETELFLARFMRHVASTMERLYYSMKVKNANILFESDKLYRSLFNSMSHEFRIPLASVMGSADTLLSDDHPKEIQTELLEAILTASTRLSRLVDNMLNISRLENNKIEARIAWMDVNDLFGNVFESLKDELAPFRAEAVVPESMPLVRLDFGLIEQSLYNLVDNSCKYAPAGSTIRLKAFYDNGYVMIQESDRGPGFAEEEIPLLFNKFYKPDNNREGGGLGLGLSIVKGFIEAHSGTISIRNRNNGGAEFTIKIPTEISYTDNLITPII
jgi:two-component system sensor histidine kinase KdpD